MNLVGLHKCTTMSYKFPGTPFLRAAEAAATEAPAPEACQEQPYRAFHYDFWQLLGDYIAPESVSTFARICRDSRRVTLGARFWNRLYLDLCTSAAARRSLPEALGPARALLQARGLKCRVVRALYHAHAPLAERAAFGWRRPADAHALKDRMCTGFRSANLSKQSEQIGVFFTS